MTIKDLAKELNVSEQALRSWCKKNNIRKERAQGTKATYVIDCDAEKQIRIHYSTNNSNESKESKATKVQKQSNESKATNSTNVDSVVSNDLQQAYIESLQQQIEELKADKVYLKERLTVAEQERDNLTRERQTILAELLELRQPKVIELKEPEVKTAAEQPKAPSPQRPRKIRQQPRSYSSSKPVSLLDTLKNLLKH